jgi:Fe-S cluster assembly protein SufD
VQNLSRETWHFASHHARVERDAELDWVAAASARRGEGPDPERPRGQGATSRVTGAYFADGEQHLDYDTFQEHIAPEHDVRLRLQGRAARRGERGLARDDPRRGRRAEDERLPGEPQPAALEDGARRLDPGLEILANDVRCTHGATLGQVDREQLFYLMAAASRARRPSG